AVFEDAVHLVGDAIGVEFDEIVCEAEYAQTTQDLDLGSWKIDAGCVAGVAASWQGRVRGRTVVDLRVRWRKGQTLAPDWEMHEGYLIQIDGQPTITTRIGILPPPDFQATRFEDFMVLGMILTAVPAINAIPRVVEAPPGIATYNDLPPPLPRNASPSARPDLLGSFVVALAPTSEQTDLEPEDAEMTTPTERGVYYDPYDVAINADPSPTFRRLRDEAPIYYNERYDFWALSRHADVEQALVDWQTFTSSRGDILEVVQSNLTLPTGII